MRLSSHTHYWYEVGILKIPATGGTCIGLFNTLNLAVLGSSRYCLKSVNSEESFRGNGAVFSRVIKVRSRAICNDIPLISKLP